AYGEREDWSRLWTPGVDRLRKVVHSADEPWTVTRDGRLKWLARAGMGVRLHGIDVYLPTVEGENSTTPPSDTPDVRFSVLRARGHTLEWQVEADIDDRYYARVARSPRRFDWEAGDVVYVAQNTVHQHVAEGGDVELVGARNRLFQLVGYDATIYRDGRTP